MGMPVWYSQFNFNRYAYPVLAVDLILPISRTRSQSWVSCVGTYGLRHSAI